MIKFDRREPHYGIYVAMIHHPFGDEVARVHFLRHGRDTDTLPYLPSIVVDTPTEAWLRSRVWDAVYDEEVVMFPAIDGWIIDLPFKTIL